MTIRSPPRANLSSIGGRLKLSEELYPSPDKIILDVANPFGQQDRLHASSYLHFPAKREFDSFSLSPGLDLRHYGLTLRRDFRELLFCIAKHAIYSFDEALMRNKVLKLRSLKAHEIVR